MVLENDENSVDLLDMINQEIDDNREEMNFERETFEVNDFVLVKFLKKKGPPEHYVGKSFPGMRIILNIKFNSTSE